jgi:aldose 1-epimerase
MKDAKSVWLKNKNLQVSVIALGGRITSLLVPDRAGNFADVVLGYSTPEEYLSGNPYYGTIIGRVANRIKQGLLQLNGKTYSLAINNPPNHLHGGSKGFHNQDWQLEKTSDTQLVLSHLSKSGTDNYPGNVTVQATYSLVDQDLIIEYKATTDEPTVLNLTHHSFFNLAGEGNPSVLNHLVHLNADAFTPVDETQIPSGEIRSVVNTPFDFREGKAIALHIDSDDEQIRFGHGYDHNWVLNKAGHDPTALSLAAIVVEPIFGRTMEVWTTAPGLQFYTGNFLDGADRGKSGKAYVKHSAFCLEPQHFPDAINHPNFPPITLSPEETYYQKSIFRFGVA